MAFVLAGIVAVATVLLALLQLFAAGMSDVTNPESGAGATLGIGLVLAALIAASHWLPHFSW